MHGDEMLDAVAALALGVLPENEARDVERAIENDPALRAEYERLRATADLTGYIAEPPAIAIDEVQAARMKSRIMKEIRATSNPATAPRTAPAVAPLQPRPAPAPPRWPAMVAAAAAVVVAAVALLSSLSLRNEVAASRAHDALLQAQVAASQARVASLESQVADLTAPDAKRYAVAGGQVIARGSRIYIALNALPKLPPGKVYQAWTLANGAKTVAPSITFVPSAGGGAVVALPPQDKQIAAVAVSVEPEGGSKAPTSKPIFIRPLT
jgi:anti-sigma-K factor RskA